MSFWFPVLLLAAAAPERDVGIGVYSVVAANGTADVAQVQRDLESAVVAKGWRVVPAAERSAHTGNGFMMQSPLGDVNHGTLERGILTPD